VPTTITFQSEKQSYITVCSFRHPPSVGSLWKRTTSSPIMIPFSNYAITALSQLACQPYVSFVFGD